jgi:SAM-dependent methyltransferase
MLQKARATPIPAGSPAPSFRKGHAEATGLSDHCADAVLAAQAFHWFKAEAAFSEFRRILKPGGFVLLMWNQCDESDQATAAYQAVIYSFPDAPSVEILRAREGNLLLTCPLFLGAMRYVFANEQHVDEEGLLGRAFSASYAPREPAQVQAFAQKLRGVFAHWQLDGFVTLRYETSVYLAQTPA